MLYRSFISALLLTFCASISAQETPANVGFYRLVNLVAPGEGRTEFFIDGETIYKKGYKVGQKTGGMGRVAGSFVLTAAKDGCTKGTRTVEVIPGKTETFVAYAVPELDDLGEVKEWKIELGRLSQVTPKAGYSVTLISFCKRGAVRVGLAIDGKDAKMHEVPSMKTLRVPVATINDGVVVKVGDETITSFSTDSEGNYVVLLYDGDDRAILGTSFYDPKFLVAG